MGEFREFVIRGCNQQVPFERLSARIFVVKLDDYRGDRYRQIANLTFLAIRTDVKRLAQIRDGRERDGKIGGYRITDAARAEAVHLVDKIEKRVEVVCSYRRVEFYDIPPTIYRPSDGSQHKEYGERIYSQIARLMNPDRTAEYNFRLAATHLAAFLAFALSLYGFMTLCLYRRLGWRKLLLISLFIFPVLTVSTVISHLTFHSEYEYLETNNQDWIIPAFVIYLFVVYPPVIAVARRAGLGVLDSLCIWRIKEKINASA